MAIDMASVYAAKYRKNPNALRAAVMGQSPDASLDSYTALNALRLIKEADMMAMAGQAQQPTSAPSIVAQNLAPPAPPQGLAGMIPMGAPAGQMPQGMPQQRAPMPQPVMQAASGGLASMPTADEDYCGGGIVAFGIGGSTDEDEYQGETTDTGYSDSQGRSVDAEGNLIDDTDVGTGSATDRFNSLLAKQIAKIQGGSSRVTSPEDAAKMEEEYYQRELKRAGPDIYKDEIARGPQDEADRLKARRVGEANALFTAAGKVLTGNRLSTGAREALPAYGSAMNEVEKADQAAKSANARAQFALKDAQRKERMGSSRAAQASMENYRKFQQDENRATMDRDRIVAELAAKGIVGNRATGKGAAGGPKLNEQLYADNVAYLMTTNKPKAGESQDAFTARIRAQAGALTAQQTKTSFSTSEVGPEKSRVTTAPIQQRIDAKVTDGMKNFKLLDRAYSKAERAGNQAEMDRLLQAEEARLRGIAAKSEAIVSGSKGSAAAQSNTRIQFDENGEPIK
jgi:hypothetical protein